MQSVVKNFYKLSSHYYSSAQILWAEIFNMPCIYNPTIYLLRHSTELALKGLIVKEFLFLDPYLATKNIEIKNGASSRKLDATHSLLCLWENYKELYLNSHLVARYDLKQKQIIEKAITFFDKKDFDSTLFRYPYNRKWEPIVIEHLDFDTSGKAPELKSTPPKIIICEGEVATIKKGSRYLQQTQQLFNATELLLSFYS